MIARNRDDVAEIGRRAKTNKRTVIHLHREDGTLFGVRTLHRTDPGYTDFVLSFAKENNLTIEEWSNTP